jgi:transposase
MKPSVRLVREISMLTRDAFQELYEQDPDALFALYQQQAEQLQKRQADLIAAQEMLLLLTEQTQQVQHQITTLKSRVHELEARLGKDSHNSNKPPSSDGLKKKPAPVSLRPKTGRKQGGQKGHPGNTLPFSDTPDHTLAHIPTCCQGCGASLECAQVLGEQRRQVVDLPPLRLEVTEHVAQTRLCKCGAMTTATFPEEACEPLQYGPRLLALGVYLRDYQLLPFARTSQLFADLFGATLCKATLESALGECSERLKPVTETIQKALIASSVLHCDETGMRVEGKLHWVHSAGTPTLTYYTCHCSRGKKGSDAAGVLSSFCGTAVHDAWSSYAQYGCKHALCNAHHLRELIPLADEGQAWAKDMMTLLVEIKTAAERAKEQEQKRLPPLLEAHFEGRYQKLLGQGYKANPPPKEPPRDKRGRPKQTPARNLLLRLDTNRQQVLAFLYDFAVPFDNNLAERDLRMIKLRQKISGGFRTMTGAEAFCRVRSYLSTLRKQGKNLLTALESVFRGSPEPVATG